MKKIDCIIAIMVGLVMVGLLYLFPKLWGIFILLGLGYWIVTSFRWGAKIIELIDKRL